MKCPKCKNELKEGYIAGNNFMYWTNNKSNKFFIKADERLLNPFKYFWKKNLQMKSYKCDLCHLVVIELPEKDTSKK